MLTIDEPQVVGNDVLTENQERLHFGLWAIAKSPLILGTDLSKISDSTLAIVKNKVRVQMLSHALTRANTDSRVLSTSTRTLWVLRPRLSSRPVLRHLSMARSMPTGLGHLPTVWLWA